jgi:hypothetical protein
MNLNGSSLELTDFGASLVSNLARPEVLLVESSDLLIEQVETILEGGAYSVSVVPGWEIAEEELRDTPPHCIVCHLEPAEFPITKTLESLFSRIAETGSGCVAYTAQTYTDDAMRVKRSRPAFENIYIQRLPLDSATLLLNVSQAYRLSEEAYLQQIETGFAKRAAGTLTKRRQNQTGMLPEGRQRAR